MQTSEKSPFDPEVLEPFPAEEMEATAPYPAQHAPRGKLTKSKYIPYLIFALCASLYFMPFMRLVRQLGGMREAFLRAPRESFGATSLPVISLKSQAPGRFTTWLFFLGSSGSPFLPLEYASFSAP